MDIDNILNTTIAIPKPLENIQLPNPDLLQYYKDCANRVFWIEGEIDDAQLDVVKAIMRCNTEDSGLDIESRKPIRIFIDSNGGDVAVMWSIIKAIKISKTPVYTINFCNCLSAAAHILASGHKRYALPGSTVLIHTGSECFGGTHEQAESMRKYFNALDTKTNEQLLSDTKIDAKIFKKKAPFDWYLDCEEALAQGIVDVIVSDFDEVMF